MPPQPAHRPRRARAFDVSPGQRSALLALLVAHLLFGAAQIAMLPPWEGFDETGHYSSIQQVADTGTVPRLPAARMSQTVVDYAAVAPMGIV